jgi:hypothetical protein
MISESVAFWVDLVASFASVIGLGAVAFELPRARRAEHTQFQFDTFKMFNIDLKHERLIEYQLNRDSVEEFTKEVISDPEKFNAYKNILDFYSLIATAAKSKSINRRNAFKIWGQPLISFWNRYEELFISRRKIMGPEAFTELEWFKSMSEKAHPEFVERFDDLKKEGQKTLKKYRKSKKPSPRS